MSSKICGSIAASSWQRGRARSASAAAAARVRLPSAQEKFPAREVNWIIYQAPGGSIDTTARIIQPYLEKAAASRPRSNMCSARAGASRAPSSATARPDGYAMMTESAPGGAIDEVIGRATYKASEFIPIYGWSVISWQICVKKDSPIRTFKDLVDECKKRRVVIGTIGRGGSSHIQLAALQKELNLPFGMVHFDGSGKAYPAVLGGHVDAAMSGPASGSRMSDSLHFLGVTGERARAGAARRADAEGAGLQRSRRSISSGTRWPRRRCRTIASQILSAARSRRRSRTRRCTSRCRRPASIVTAADPSRRSRSWCAKQAEVIEKYKDLLT